MGSLLVSEVDRDVSAAVSTTITLLDKIEVCESQVSHSLAHTHTQRKEIIDMYNGKC